MSTIPTGRLYNLLPALYRVRDSEQGEPLRALLAILEAELATLEADVAGLYENWFIETCEEWVVPYIADLLGVRGFKPIAGGAFTARPYAAHTLRYRRQKGTAAMLEQLARDVTNWPARVIEFFQFLDTTQHLNHPRPRNVSTPDLRDTGALELLGGPFDQAARTLEVRPAASNRGRYNVPNLGIFLWRLESYPVERSTARPDGDGSNGRYRFHPLGIDAPLFNQPAATGRIAGERDVPGPLRRRALYDDLEALRQAIVDRQPFDSVYFGSAPVFSISVAGAPIPPERIVICDLSEHPAPPATARYTPPAGGDPVDLPITASVDPVSGRLAFAAGSIPAKPSDVLVSYSYGFSANLGGGPYDRGGTLPLVPDGQRLWQVAVTQELPADNALVFATLGDAAAAWAAQPAGTFGIIAILDSRTYSESPAIVIPENSRLVLVAAGWPGLHDNRQTLELVNVRPHILGSLQVTGTAAPNSPAPGALTVNGLLIDGSLTVEPGNLGGLELVHCTLVPSGGGVQVAANLDDALRSLAAPLALPIKTNGGPPPPPPVPRITTISPLPPAMAGDAYSKQFTAVNGTGFSWDASDLPPWLTMSAGGLLKGTPPGPGAVQFTVVVTNAEDGVREGLFTLPVNAALAIATASALPLTTAGVPFSQTLAATGGTGVYTWSGTGLPAWLTLSAAGVLTGTPPDAGNVTFTVTVSDSTGAARSSGFSLAVNAALAIGTPSALPAATANAPFSFVLAATGGTGTPRWSATGLPSWLTLTTAGVLAGTPPAAGSSSFTATVTDGAGAVESRGFSLLINPPLVITTTSPLPAATAGAPFSLALAAAGGSGEFIWSAAGQPAWLSLSPAGVLTGTPPAAGTAAFTITVKDSSGAAQSADLSLPVNPALAITTASPLPPATLDTAYHQALTASGGAGGFHWSASGLPSWLTLSSNGVLTGTPPELGTAEFKITVTDSNGLSKTGTFALTVNPPPLAIATTQLAGGATNVAYGETLAGSGGAPPLAWAVTAGALPAGLALDKSTGAIAGTPSATGNFRFTVQLTDSASSAPALREFVIAIVSGLSITTAPALPAVTAGVGYAQTLAAAGGTLPLGWSVTAGALPAGLSLDPATGAIAGTPSAAGEFFFTVKVTDSAAVSGSKEFTLVVAPAPAVATTALPPGTVGASYSQVIAVDGGTAPFAWSITADAPPDGIALDGVSGALSGNPSKAGTFGFTVEVKDASLATASQRLTIAIAPPLAIATASPLPRGTAATAYSERLRATGGTAPLNWRVTNGSLPAGLLLSASGTLDGAPSGPASATFTAQVTDAAGATAAAQFVLTVAPPLAISTPVLPPGEVAAPYSASLAASGGTPPYSWRIAEGALPSGLAITPNGVIGGTPTGAADSKLTIQVTDSNSVSAAEEFTVSIAALLGIVTAAALPNGETGADYSAEIAAGGGLPPYRWTITAAALPPGLVISPAGVTGAIHGAPAAAGTFTFTVTATDTTGVSASREFTTVIVANNPSLAVTLRRTICGPLALSAAGQLTLIDSVVDGAGAAAILAPAADAVIEASTVLGGVGAAGSSGLRTLEASNSIFTGPVFVERRQAGCVRFCYLAKDSRTPRRYRCQPDLALKDIDDPRLQALIRARLAPAFTSILHGQPGYAQLATACAAEIRTGAEDGSEMGAFDFVKKSQREDNLRASLEEYLRFPLEAGIFFVT